MKVRGKQPEDQPWIEKILTERWGGVRVLVHDETFDAHLLPASASRRCVQARWTRRVP
jgi:hypothetical protein